MNKNNQNTLDMDDVVHRIIKVRKEKKLTKIQMSRYLKVTDSTYYKYEKRIRFPTAEPLVNFAKAFGLSLQWVFLGQGPMLWKDLIEQEKYTQLQNQLTKEKETLQQKEEEHKQNTINTIKITKPEIRELTQNMETNPELFYAVMLEYHRFKK